MKINEIKSKVANDDFVIIKASSSRPNEITCEVIDATGNLIESAKYSNEEMEKARQHLFVFAESWAAKETPVILNPFIN